MHMDPCCRSGIGTGSEMMRSEGDRGGEEEMKQIDTDTRTCFFCERILLLKASPGAGRGEGET